MAKYFDNWEAFETIVDPAKVKIFKHPAKHIIMLGAKDTGKSSPVNWYKIYGLEKDSKANVVTLQKYSTAAALKGSRTITKALNEIKNMGFSLKRTYLPSTRAYYRLPPKKTAVRDMKVRMMSQVIDFDSFEDSNRLADFALPNGGYPFLIHIEEPVLQNDSNTTSDEEWLASYKTIKDSIQRSYTDYRVNFENKQKANPEINYAKPLPFKIISTLNDWDPEHYLSKMFKIYFPQQDFVNWVLGFDYMGLLKLWQDKISGLDVIPQIQEVVDKRWSEIKNRLLTHHTKMIYLNKDNQGQTVDTLLVRMQKFANPRNRYLQEQETTYDEIYNALITGDSLSLAKAMGTGYDGSSWEEKLFNFKNFVPVNTNKILKEPKRRIELFSLGVDHDVNRGIVLSPVTLTKIVVGNSLEGFMVGDYKVLVHPQHVIPAYGKGVRGELTKLYHQQIIQECEKIYHQYLIKNTNNIIVFDDDDGSYVSHIAEKLYNIGYKEVIIVDKHGKIEEGGYGIESRDNMVQISIDIEELLIDRENELLIDFLKRVPRIVKPSGKISRSQKGKWGTKLKDHYDAMTYALFPIRSEMYEGLNLGE